MHNFIILLVILLAMLLIYQNGGLTEHYATGDKYKITKNTLLPNGIVNGDIITQGLPPLLNDKEKNNMTINDSKFINKIIGAENVLTIIIDRVGTFRNVNAIKI